MAAVVVLLSPALGLLLLVIAGVCYTFALGWDFYRWHWPFLPSEIEDQISRGQELLVRPDFDMAALLVWQQKTRDQLKKIWTMQSRQLSAFENAGGAPGTKPAGFHRDILIKQIHVLKELDPTWL